MTESHSTDAPVLEELTREECVELIATLCVGRIAVGRADGAPHVVPVNYVLEADVVVFRTDEGSKLTALREQPVTFQVDEIDPFHRTGWSVMVQGTAIETIESDQAGASWAGAGKHHVVRIEPMVVSGRRIRLPDVILDARGYL